MKNLNLDFITQDLWDIQEECEEIRWFTDSDDGEDSLINAFAEDEAKRRLKQMTKDELIAAARQCFKVYQAYIGLRNRYDSMKAAIDILRDQNTGYLQVVREIEKLYESVSKDMYSMSEHSKESQDWKRYTDALPQEAWIT